MWLYPEVLPVRVRRLRPWLLAAVATVAIALVIPRAPPALPPLPVVEPTYVAATLEHRLATVDRRLDRDTGAQLIPPCDESCRMQRDELIRERRELVARLRALRARTSLAPQRATGLPVPPACIETPLAHGCE